VPKIISECCELVKLCRINCSGPVLLRHSVFSFKHKNEQKGKHRQHETFINRS